MKGYLLSVICVTFICTLVGAIGGDGPGKELRRMLTGCALAITILAPVVKLDFPEFRTDSLLRDASAAVREGEEQADSAKAQCIRSAIEAYILTKAESMGLSLTVQVALDDTGMPRSVNLTGSWSPRERQHLSDLMESDLGLGKEVQTWTQAYQSGA